MKTTQRVIIGIILSFTLNFGVVHATINTVSIPYTGTGTAGVATCGAPQAITLPTNSANLTASLAYTTGFSYSYWNLTSFTDLNGNPATPPTLSWQNQNPTSWPSTTVVSGMTTAGIYNYKFTAAKSDGSTYPCTTYVEVDPAAPYPDLVSGGVTPTSAVAGTATQFQSTITNQGTDTTGIAFYTLFQVATGANGTGTITDINPVTAYGPLAAGSSLTAKSPSPGYSFGSVGTYYVRACADKRNSSVTTGDIDENPSGSPSPNGEDNNCSAWTTVTVSSGVGPVGVTLYANSVASNPTIDKGQSVTLTWSSSNATTCSGTNFNTGGAVTNSTGVTLTPTASITYSITCTNTQGGSGSDSRSVTVVVYQCNDNTDNDGDGKIDYPNDPGCTSATDNDETDVSSAQCSNGIDDDGDGKIDYPNDPGCKSPTDNDERDPKTIFFWEQ